MGSSAASRKLPAGVNRQVLDQDLIAQQSAYLPGAAQQLAKEGKMKPPPGKRATVIRKSGGKVWEDQTLVDWDPSEFPPVSVALLLSLSFILLHPTFTLSLPLLTAPSNPPPLFMAHHQYRRLTAEWYRLFVGDVSNDVSERTLDEAFSKYPSYCKSKVVRDRLSLKAKYGFIAFKDPEDFLRAWKENDGGCGDASVDLA